LRYISFYPAPLEYLVIDGEDEEVQYFLKENLALYPAHLIQPNTDVLG